MKTKGKHEAKCFIKLTSMLYKHLESSTDKTTRRKPKNQQDLPLNPNQQKLKRFYRYGKNDKIHYNRHELIHTNVWPGGFRMRTPTACISKRRAYKPTKIPDIDSNTTNNVENIPITSLRKRMRNKSSSMDLSPWIDD